MGRRGTHLKALERRLVYLAERIEKIEATGNVAAWRGFTYDVDEHAALEWALDTLHKLRDEGELV